MDAGQGGAEVDLLPRRVDRAERLLGPLGAPLGLGERLHPGEEPVGLQLLLQGFLDHQRAAERVATRLRVDTLDPKLAAATFGMDPGRVMIYLADRIDPGRLPDQSSTRRLETS